MKTRTILLAAVLMVIALGARAQELNEDQETAKTIFENNFFDAQEKLRQLRLRELVMEWSEYEEVTIKPLEDSLAEAKRVGVPGATPIGFDTPVPFSQAAREAAEMRQKFRTAFSQKNDKLAIFRNGQTPENLRRYEKFKEQYTRGLTGDKLRIMNEDVLINGVVYAQDPPKFFINYYGPGKKVLATPADFASASVWGTAEYVYASDDTLKLDPHWHAWIYHFNGDKLVNSTEHRGPGKVAPATLFK